MISSTAMSAQIPPTTVTYYTLAHYIILSKMFKILSNFMHYCQHNDQNLTHILYQIMNQQKIQQQQQKQKVKVSYKDRGNQLYRNQQYVMASAMYKKHIKKLIDNHSPSQLKNTDIDKTYFNVALCFYKLNQYQKCIQACKKAIYHNPSYLKAYYRLVSAYKETKDEYNAMITARDYCELIRNNQLQQTAEYKQMRTFFKKILDKISETEPIMLSGKYKVIKQEEDKKSTQQKPQIQTKLINWNLVKQLINNNNIKQGINLGYYILQTATDKQQKNKIRKLLNNLKEVDRKKEMNQEYKIINISRTFQIFETHIYDQNNQYKNNEIKLSLYEQQTESLKINEQNPVNLQRKSIEQLYVCVFEKQMQKYSDIFQGFYLTLKKILTNTQYQQTNDDDTLKKLLETIAKKYGMFDILRQSLSKRQIEDLQKIINRKFSKENAKILLTLYCH